MPKDALPAAAGDLAATRPEVWQAFARLGEVCADAGPIAGSARHLVKLALAIGVASEGAVHSHVRRALDDGISAEELKHVALLAIPTIGFPRAIAVLSWIEDVTDAT
jgi:alkylhydroperoxidase/carboxymuconolactone decarboxylase family protein YurZ